MNLGLALVLPMFVSLNFSHPIFRRFHVPVAFYVMLSASHLLLVVNSSINVVLYCVVGKSFRAELKSLARSVCAKWGIRVDQFGSDSGGGGGQLQSYYDDNTTVHHFPSRTTTNS